jgi:hypothetical protein
MVSLDEEQSTFLLYFSHFCIIHKQRAQATSKLSISIREVQGRHSSKTLEGQRKTHLL